MSTAEIDQALKPDTETTTTATTADVDADAPRQVRYDDGWLLSIQRPAMIAIMVACINVVLLTFLRRLLPDIQLSYSIFLTGMGVAAAVVGCTTTTWLSQPEQRIRRTASYRAAELGLLLVTTRLAVWITTGNWPMPRELFTRPLASFLDGGFLLAMAVVTLSWVIATEMSRDLLDMGLQPDELRLVEDNRSREGGQPVASNRRLLHNSFVARWIIGGVIIVILAAGARVTLAGNGLFAITRQNIPSSVVLSIVIYFLLGLILISQGRLAILRARWTIEQTPDRSTVTRDWPYYVFAVVAGVGILAAFLPFGGTYYLALVVTTIIRLLYGLLFFIFQLLSAIMLLILSLLPFSEEGEPLQEQSAEPIAPQIPPEAPPEFLEWAGGAMFWILAMIIVGYLGYIYFSDKGNNFGWLRRLWHLLRLRWLTLRNTYSDWVESRISRMDGDGDGQGRSGFWRRWGQGRRNYSPEERIRYFYLSALEEARSVGVGRHRAETPGRYAPRLESTLTSTPEAETDRSVQELTDAFVDVRYARQSRDEGAIALLEAHWQRLRKRLRGHRDEEATSVHDEVQSNDNSREDAEQTET